MAGPYLQYIHAVFDGLRAAIQRGDLLVANSDAVLARLAKGSAGSVLKSNGTDVSWDTNLTIAGTVVNLTNLPTSAAGLAAGDIWVDTTGGLNILKRV